MDMPRDGKEKLADQKCRYCNDLFTEKALRKHLLKCPGPTGKRACDLTGAARARRLKILFEGPKKKKKGRSVFTINGGAFGLGKSRKH